MKLPRVVKVPGFFRLSTLLQEAPVSLVPKCGACGLYLDKECLSPKMPVSGEGRKGILIVGEAPGRDEDRQGIPFVGKSGRFLDRVLQKYGVRIRRDCWTTNSLICRPPGNRTPTDKEVGYCRPNLIRAIKELRPQVILLCGGSAVRSLIGRVWQRGAPGPVSRWVGWDIPDQTFNAWICPTYHPSYLLRMNDPVLDLLFNRHLEQALGKDLCPWEQIPNYEGDVEVIFEHDEAAKIIREMIQRGGMSAFDYETNMLKPDGPNAEIVCCSISWRGRRTIAYPWYGEAIKATQEFLRSPLPKVASNLKFEERWTQAIFGHGVRNWKWDTMLAAHVLDNRRGITSIKFQAFVLLGMSSYGDLIEPFFRSENSRTENRIREVDLRQLLIYCGLDSLLEYKVAMKQMKKLGVCDDG